MGILWKERVIVSYLEKYLYEDERTMFSIQRTGVTEFDFVTYLIFKKKALMPASYYISYLIPVFNRKISLEYHIYIEFLIRKAIEDGFIIPRQDSTDISSHKRNLLLSDKGRMFITWEGFTDQIIENKKSKISLVTSLLAAFGGISFVIILIHGYQYVIDYIAKIILPH